MFDSEAVDVKRFCHWLKGGGSSASNRKSGGRWRHQNGMIGCPNFRRFERRIGGSDRMLTLDAGVWCIFNIASRGFVSISWASCCHYYYFAHQHKAVGVKTKQNVKTAATASHSVFIVLRKETAFFSAAGLWTGVEPRKLILWHPGWWLFNIIVFLQECKCPKS